MSVTPNANQLHVLGVSGSLRAGSFNRALLVAAQGLAPAGMEIAIFVEAEGDPEPVLALKSALRAADALLLASPEYNYSVSGVLKNALDWASRPPSQSPLTGKPVAILGASTGAFGTARGQHHLRQVCQATGMLTMPRPEVMIPRAQEKYDAEGRLTDDVTLRYLRVFLQGLADWVLRLRA